MAWSGTKGPAYCQNIPGGKDGKACTDAFKALLKSLGVKSISTKDKCAELRRLTVKDAKAKGMLAGGGSLLAVDYACFQDNWSDALVCNTFDPKHKPPVGKVLSSLTQKPSQSPQVAALREPSELTQAKRFCGVGCWRERGGKAERNAKHRIRQNHEKAQKITNHAVGRARKFREQALEKANKLEKQGREKAHKLKKAAEEGGRKEIMAKARKYSKMAAKGVDKFISQHVGGYGYDWIRGWQKTAHTCRTKKDCTAGDCTAGGGNLACSALWEYVKKTTSNTPTDNKISLLQHLWQNNMGPEEKVSFVICGTIVKNVLDPLSHVAKKSHVAKSILQANTISNINCKLAEQIKNGDFQDKYLNFVYIDNAAHCGRELAKALRKHQILHAVKMAMKKGSLK